MKVKSPVARPSARQLKLAPREVITRIFSKTGIVERRALVAVEINEDELIKWLGITALRANETSTLVRNGIIKAKLSEITETKI